MEGLQETFGEKEFLIQVLEKQLLLDQGIGLSMRGLRPISEIQYLDYLLYSIQLLSDDLLAYITEQG